MITAAATFPKTFAASSMKFKENERKENERKENERKENERKVNERKVNERKVKPIKMCQNFGTRLLS